MGKINFILYARKSTDTVDKQVLSLDSQVEELTILAKKLGLNIVEIILESKSAKAPGREKFNQMLDNIEAGKAQAILCWKIDRLARNPIDAGRISWLLQREIIKQIQTFSHVYLPTDNVLLMSVETGLSTQYIRDLSDNVKRGMLTKVKSGWLANKPPMGYINNTIKNSDTPIIKDPERFDIVRSIFDLVLSGVYSPNQILNKVNDEFRLRTIKRGREGDKLLTRSKLYWLLHHPFYYGDFKWNGEAYSGKQEPMITVDEFTRVQELLGTKGKARPHNKTFAYTGLIRCEECGCMVSADEKKKPAKNGGFHRYVYYMCTKKKPKVKCSQHGIREEELERQFKNLLSQIHIDEEIVALVIGDLKRMHAEEAATQQTRLASIQRTYQGVQNKLNNLLSVRLDGLITDEEYKSKKNQIMLEKARLEEKLQDNSGRTGDWLNTAERTFNFASHAVKAFENKKGTIEQKKVIIQAFGANFILKDRNLHAEIREPFIFVKNCLTGVGEETTRSELLQTATQSRGDTPILSKIPTGWAQ